MKVVFVIDHSPLMNIKSEQGLTYFQQSVYAIESFIQRRIVLGLFKQDKYFLYGLENSNIDINQSGSSFDSIFNSLNNKKQPNIIKPSLNKDQKYSSRLYSGWEHPYKHFYQQLINLQCQNAPNTPASVSAGLKEIMGQLNSKRMYTGADIRFFGIQLNKIEPCNVIVFTQSKLEGIGSFLDLKPETQNFYKEIFRFDQKLNVVSFREENEELRILAEKNGGQFYQYSDGFIQLPVQAVMHGFQGLKQFVVHLSSIIEPVAQLDVEFKNHAAGQSDPKSINLYFQSQIASNQPSSLSNSGYHCAHRSNSEVKEPKVDQKLKWPLPLESQNFISKGGPSGSNSIIWFGTSIPKLIIDDPIQIEKEDFDEQDGSASWDPKLLADVIAIHDSNFTQFFVNKHISTKTNSELDKLLRHTKWPVYMSGESEAKPFGYIKACRLPSLEIVLHLHVLPLDFSEFSDIMRTLNEYTQYKRVKKHEQIKKPEAPSNTQQYSKFKWKQRFDNYREKMPAYYNDYMNACLKFVDSRNRQLHGLQMKGSQQSSIQSLLLPDTMMVYRDQRPLNDLGRQINNYQEKIEYNDENRFLKSKTEHERWQQIPTFCCLNLVKVQKKKTIKGTKSDKFKERGEAEAGPVSKNFEFELINNFSSPANFIDQVIWQVNQLSFETLQPLNFDQILGKDEVQQAHENMFAISKDETVKMQIEKTNDQIKGAEKNEEDHCIPIGIMSDVEGHFREKLKTIPRDPSLNQQEFMDKIKPFMGNPFTAPGTIGARSVQKIQKKQQPRNEQERQLTKSTEESDSLSQNSKNSASQILDFSSISEESNFISNAQGHKITKELERQHEKPKQQNKMEIKRNKKKKPKEKTQMKEPLYKAIDPRLLRDVFLHAQNLIAGQNTDHSKPLPSSSRSLEFTNSLSYYIRHYNLPTKTETMIFNKLIKK